MYKCTHAVEYTNSNQTITTITEVVDDGNQKKDADEQNLTLVKIRTYDTHPNLNTIVVFCPLFDRSVHNS